jgi:hypothetical protein
MLESSYSGLLHRNGSKGILTGLMQDEHGLRRGQEEGVPMATGQEFHLAIRLALVDLKAERESAIPSLSLGLHLLGRLCCGDRAGPR